LAEKKNFVFQLVVKWQAVKITSDFPPDGANALLPRCEDALTFTLGFF